MLRKPQNTERMTKACSKTVQFSDFVRTSSSPAPQMAQDRSVTDSTSLVFTPFLFSESDFDKEVNSLLQEFDKKCAKLWEEEDHRFQQSLKPQAHIKVLPPPKMKQQPKPRPVLVTTTTSSSDNKGTFRSELHLREFPRKKSTPKFVGVLKQEKTLTSEKFELEIDVTGFEMSELTVRTEGDRLLVNAKTQKSNGNPAWILRELKRNYRLPDDVDPYDVTAVLVSHGQLRIEAPIKKQI